jgi:diguanylate cyclase (GGDEF)-like protein
LELNIFNVKEHGMAEKFSFVESTPSTSFSSERYSIRAVIHYTAILGCAGHFLFIGLFWWLGILPMAVFNIVSCSIFAQCYFLNERGQTHRALLLGISEVTAHAFLAVIYVGWQSGFHYYILALVPLIFYSQTWNTLIKACVTMALCSIYILLYVFSINFVPLHYPMAIHSQLLAIVNIFTLFVVLSALAYVYRSAATHAEGELKKANDQLEVLAHTDSLTKLSNRRRMEEEIELSVRAFQRYNRPFCVVLGDIDNFKRINDQYSHAGGDQILTGMAELMISCVRSLDRIARWGGEEFLILLPDINSAEAEAAANRIREKLAATQFMVCGEPVHVTITFGCASFDGSGDVNDLIHRADLSMYAGKQAGKNCVVVYHPEDLHPSSQPEMG